MPSTPSQRWRRSQSSARNWGRFDALLLFWGLLLLRLSLLKFNSILISLRGNAGLFDLDPEQGRDFLLELGQTDPVDGRVDRGAGLAQGVRRQGQDGAQRGVPLEPHDPNRDDGVRRPSHRPNGPQQQNGLGDVGLDFPPSFFFSLLIGTNVVQHFQIPSHFDKDHGVTIGDRYHGQAPTQHDQDDHVGSAQGVHREAVEGTADQKRL